MLPAKYHAEELTHAHEEEGASAPFFEDYMKRNGFTLIEMLVAIVVVCVIA